MVYRDLVGRIIDFVKVNSFVSATIRLNNFKKTSSSGLESLHNLILKTLPRKRANRNKKHKKPNEE